MALPNFIIIGAMKCATTSLHEQLARLSGFSMSNPKEPNYFSDNEVYEKGEEWYLNLFKDDSRFRGESSTHYTKMPTYPETINRMVKAGLTDMKFIYVIRHPVDRLVSQFVHEWSQGEASRDINKELHKKKELIEYSRYAYQLEFFLQKFDRSQVKIVFYENIKDNPDSVLQEVCRFLGYNEPVHWNEDVGRKNVSSERIRKFPLYDLVINHKFLVFIRRNFIPKTFRESVKKRLRMNKRPEINAKNLERIEAIFTEDLEKLSVILGKNISLKNYFDEIKA